MLSGRQAFPQGKGWEFSCSFSKKLSNSRRWGEACAEGWIQSGRGSSVFVLCSFVAGILSVFHSPWNRHWPRCPGVYRVRLPQTQLSGRSGVVNSGILQMQASPCWRGAVTSIGAMRSQGRTLLAWIHSSLPCSKTTLVSYDHIFSINFKLAQK